MGRPKGSWNKSTIIKQQQQLLSEDLPEEVLKVNAAATAADTERFAIAASPKKVPHEIKQPPADVQSHGAKAHVQSHDARAHVQLHGTHVHDDPESPSLQPAIP